jgi:hypothetical protein
MDNKYCTFCSSPFLLWVLSILFKIDIEMTCPKFVVNMVLNLVFVIYQKHGSSNIQCSIQEISRWGRLNLQPPTLNLVKP